MALYALYTSGSILSGADGSHLAGNTEVVAARMDGR